MSILSQFNNLDLKDAYQWPNAPKYMLFGLIAAVVMGLGWYGYVSDKSLQLETIESQEISLKNVFQEKYLKTQSLEALKKQKADVTDQVASLEGLLPNKTEMDKLLADINQLGVRNGLNFDLFKPSDPKVENYYAQIPLDIKIKGKYHNIANFVAEVAAMPRIINSQKLTLSEEGLTGGLFRSNLQTIDKGGRDRLVLEGVLNTYRLLDSKEKEQARKKMQAEQEAKMAQPMNKTPASNDTAGQI
jgi:type IV pilus assembly protein PilO